MSEINPAEVWLFRCRIITDGEVAFDFLTSDREVAEREEKWDKPGTPYRTLVTIVGPRVSADE